MLPFLVIAACSFAQSDLTLHVILKTDGSRLFGYADERDLRASDLKERIVKVRLDEPWSDTIRWENIRGYDISDSSKPMAGELEQYYTDEWTKRGGIQIDTPHGRRWVIAAEQELADRAAKMAAANEQAVRKTIATHHNSAPSTVEGPAAPGFGQLWGAHIAVLTLGIGLSALTVWFLILE